MTLRAYLITLRGRIRETMCPDLARLRQELEAKQLRIDVLRIQVADLKRQRVYQFRVEQLMHERNEAQAEVERLRADAERLDWLAANPREGSIRIGTDIKPVVFWGVSAAPGVDLRFAIDAALKEPK